MTVEGLIHNLKARGASLPVEGDRLVIDAPRGVLGREEVERLRALKPELLAFICAKQDRGEALAVLQRLKTFTLPCPPAGCVPPAKSPSAAPCVCRGEAWKGLTIRAPF